MRCNCVFALARSRRRHGHAEPAAVRLEQGKTRSRIRRSPFLDGYKRAYAAIYERHDYAAGIAQLKALKHDDHPDVANLIGYSNRKLGNYDESKIWYEAALKADPTHVRTWQYYGLWQLEQGNQAQAKIHLDKIASLCGHVLPRIPLARRSDGHGRSRRTADLLTRSSRRQRRIHGARQPRAAPRGPCLSWEWRGVHAGIAEQVTPRCSGVAFRNTSMIHARHEPGWNAISDAECGNQSQARNTCVRRKPRFAHFRPSRSALTAAAAAAATPPTGSTVGRLIPARAAAPPSRQGQHHQHQGQGQEVRIPRRLQASLRLDLREARLHGRDRAAAGAQA